MRPFTRWAATEIERCLERNDNRGKPPWETAPISSLMDKLKEEMWEVEDAYEVYVMPGFDDIDTHKTRHLIDELFDLAATAAMIASKLDIDMSQLRRGFIP